MKTIIIAVLSVFLLIGCRDFWSPKKEDPPPDPWQPWEDEPEETALYLGIVIVEMESGDPCQNAMVYMFDALSEDEEWFYAGIQGNIHIGIHRERYKGDDEFEDYIYPMCRIYIDRDYDDSYQVHFIWMKKGDVQEEIPIYTVIFPDSLAPG